MILALGYLHLRDGCAHQHCSYLLSSITAPLHPGMPGCCCWSKGGGLEWVGRQTQGDLLNSRRLTTTQLECDSPACETAIL